MILVVGATGKVGREAVWLLAERKIPVRVFVYSSEKQPCVFPPLVETALGDLRDPRTLDPALEGQRAVDAQPLHPGLGERRELGHQRITFGGLRPITGNWAISTTLPLIGRLSSPIQ